MPVYINNFQQITKRLGINDNGEIQKFFTNTCYKHMTEYVPMDKGDLRTIVDIEPTFIIYESPYASYQYYGQRQDGSHKVENYTTEGTGPYWDKQMMTAEGDDIRREVVNELRKRTN